VLVPARQRLKWLKQPKKMNPKKRRKKLRFKWSKRKWIWELEDFLAMMITDY
jgi:hypothetical protein